MKIKRLLFFSTLIVCSVGGFGKHVISANTTNYFTVFSDIAVNNSRTNDIEVFNVTGGGAYCSNTTNYPSIGLDGSQPAASGVMYELLRNGVFVAERTGTGGAFNFAYPAAPQAGTYTVRAYLIDDEDINQNMAGNAIIIVHNPPTVTVDYNELGPPANCGWVSFDVTVNGMPNPENFSYEWFFSTSNYATDTVTDIAPTFAFPVWGAGFEDVDIELFVTDINGCIGTAAETVNIQQRPHA